MHHRVPGWAVPFLSTVRNTLDTKTEHQLGHGHGYMHRGKAFLAFPRTLHDAVICFVVSVLIVDQLESTILEHDEIVTFNVNTDPNTDPVVTLVQH